MQYMYYSSWLKLESTQCLSFTPELTRSVFIIYANVGCNIVWYMALEDGLRSLHLTMNLVTINI